MFIDPTWILPGCSWTNRNTLAHHYNAHKRLSLESFGGINDNRAREIAQIDLSLTERSVYNVVCRYIENNQNNSSFNPDLTFNWTWIDEFRHPSWDAVTRESAVRFMASAPSIWDLWDSMSLVTTAISETQYRLIMLKWMFNVFRKARFNMLENPNVLSHSFRTADFICLVSDNRQRLANLGICENSQNNLRSGSLVLANRFHRCTTLFITENTFNELFSGSTSSFWRAMSQNVVVVVDPRRNTGFLQMLAPTNTTLSSTEQTGDLELEYLSRPENDQSGIITLNQLREMFNGITRMAVEDREIIYEVLLNQRLT